MNRTLPVALVVLLVGAVLTVGAVAATDVVQFGQTDGVETDQEASLTFDDQATASSTFAGDGVSDPGVVVEDVAADVDSAVVVTYAETGLEAGDEVVIDLDNVGLDAWEVNGVSGATDDIEDVVVEDVENPTLIFVEGVEYTFEELPGDSNHPLEFFDEAGDALLSQDGEGSFEDDPEVGWEDTDDSVTFTVTEALAAELDGYICTFHSSMEGGTQTTAEDEDELVVAGLDTFTAGELDGGNVAIPVEDTGGFPGGHVAHVIPVEELSGEYEPGDVVSDETAGAVLANEGATVFQGIVEFEDQTFDEPIEEGDEVIEVATADLLDGAGDDTEFVVDIHPTDDEGNLVAAEFLGASDVLVGQNDGVTITAERVPEDGEFNEFPLTGTDDVVAMIHIVDDDAEPGDPASPGQYPLLAHGSTDGFVPGGVTDAGTYTVDDEEPTQSVTFDDQSVDEMTVTADGVQSDGVESALVVTYADGEELVVAGLEVGTFDDESVQVAIEDNGGLPGDHTAHILPTADLSGEYEPGDVVSDETADSVLDQDTGTVTIDVTGDGNAATDTTGDGNLNDVTGDGEFDIFDVQALFDNLDSVDVQANANLFDFAGIGDDRVSIFDVQGLFTELQAQNGA